MSRLDWTDPAAVTQWLGGLRETFADMDAAMVDMLAPARKRRLGHMTHAAIYRAAYAQLLTALAFAKPEPEHGDPAGSGGSGAE